MAEKFNEAPNPVTDELSAREGAKYYLGGLSAIAGGIGLAGEIAGSSDRAEVALGIAVVFGAASALSTETFGLKNMLNSYAEECTALILSIGTPILLAMANSNDIRVNAIGLVTGEVAAIGSLIASRRKSPPKYPVRE